MPPAAASTLYTADRNTAPGLGCVQFAADVPQQPGRAFEIFCTVPGIVQLTFPDGSILPFYMAGAGPYSRNYGITGFTASGTTASFTAWNIK